MKITTPITDVKLINSLPDTSVFNYFNKDDLTADDVKNLFSQKITRKKIQYLFEYQFSDDTRNQLASILMKKFEDTLKSGSGNANAKITEDQKNHILIANNTVYQFDIFNIGNSLFQIDKFNKIFFTDDMIDFIFGLNDFSFLRALMSIPSFWNNLMADDKLYTHFKEKHAGYFQYAYKDIKNAFVKIIVKEAGLDVPENYDTLSDVIADGTLIELIKDSDAISIYHSSIYGGIVEMFYNLKLAYNESADLDENIKTAIQAMKDPAQYKYAENPFLLQRFYDNQTDLWNQGGRAIALELLSKDTSTGKLVLEYSGMEDDYTFTQLLNTPAYSKYVTALMLGYGANVILDSTALLNVSNLYKKYIDIVKENTLIKVGPMCVNNSDNSKVFLFTTNNNVLNSFDVVFPDNTSTKFKIKNNVVKFDQNIVAPMLPGNSKECGVITADLEAYGKESWSASDLVFLLGKKIYYFDTIKEHIFAIDTRGYLNSNKFVSDDKVELPEIKNVSVTNDGYAVVTKSIVLLGGNIDGKNIEEIQKTINTNLKDVNKVFLNGNDIVVILNSGAVKAATETELIDYTGFNDLVEKDKDGKVTDSAVQNGIVKVVYRLDTPFVLDAKNNLWYQDKDKTIVKKVNVGNIETAGEGVLVEPTDADNYVLVLFNNKIRQYDYLYNL